MRQWHRLPRKVVESPSLGGLKNCRVVAVRDVDSGGDGLVVGHDDLILVVFFNLDDSVFLRSELSEGFQHSAPLQTGGRLARWPGCLVSSLKPSFSAMQTSQREMEATLQKRLDEVSDELRKTQTSYRSLVADAEKAKGQQQSIAGEDHETAQG